MLSLELVDLKTECDSLKSQIILFKEEIQIHNSVIYDLKQTNDELKIENNSLTEHNQLLTYHVKCYHELKDCLNAMNNANTHLTADIDKFKQHTKRFENQRNELTQEVDLYRLKSFQQEISNEMNQQQIANCKQMESEQNEIILQLQHAVQTLESQLNAFKMVPNAIAIDEEKTQQTVPYLHHLNAARKSITKIPFAPNTPITKNMITTPGIDARDVAFGSYEDLHFFRQRSQSTFSVRSNSGRALLDYEMCGNHDLQTIVTQQKDEYENLLLKLETVEKKCQEQKVELKKKSHAINELRAKNKELGKGKKSCYMFDFFQFN